MAEYKKETDPGKVQDQGNQKYKIQKNKEDELDADVQLQGKGAYVVEKLKMLNLPDRTPDKKTIRWFNNFSIKKDDRYITETYKVTLAGLSAKLGKSKLVIFDGKNDPYYYQGQIINDTIELTGGDPAIGGAP